MRIPDCLLVGLPHTQMIESDAQWLQADGSQLPQIHRVFAENAGIDALIEIHTALYGSPCAIPMQFSTRGEAKVTDFCNDLLEPWAGNNVVVHQHEVLLRTIQFVNCSYEIG